MNSDEVLGSTLRAVAIMGPDMQASSEQMESKSGSIPKAEGIKNNL